MVEFKKIPCPFCKSPEVEAEIIPKEVKRKTARVAGRTSTVVWTVPEKTMAITNCTACGKSKTEINKALKGETSTMSSEDKRRRFEELRKLREEMGLNRGD
jgi:hypothetical protein